MARHRVAAWIAIAIGGCNVGIEPSPPAAPPPELPSPPPIAPAPPPMIEPPPIAPSVCAAVRVRYLGTEPRRRIPVHLPHGGTRALLRVVNDGDRPIVMPARQGVIFTDRDRVTLEPRDVLDPSDWFMPFEVPAHGATEIGVTFGPELGTDGRTLIGIRADGVHAVDAPFETCTVEETALDGSDPAPR